MNATMQPLLPTMNARMRPLLLSLKPCYADRVFEGLKTVELRRRIASHIKDRDVFVYVSSPVMELRGGFRAGDFWHGTPEEIWSKVSELARVDKQDFDTYFEGQTIAYAFEITEVWEAPNPIDLNTLRSQFPNFVVPQSWRYVRNDESEFFEKIKPQTNKFLEQHHKDTQLPDLQHAPFDGPQSHTR
ncbi:hypothetical protein F4054_07550 [Candidatus Poribacteria bacterium]|nr:hypothetical protein [Candidatus Poribacteria bacterium]